MPVPSFLMSFLVRQHLSAKGVWAEKYGGSWLVWEPGDWSPPKGVSTAISRSKVKKPRPGDALCYHLAAVSGAALEVGRSDTCDIVLNDATVSRSHLALEEQGGGWVAATLVPDPLKSVRLRGRPLMVGEHPRLVSGDELRLGDVTLTFLEATALRARVNALQG